VLSRRLCEPRADDTPFVLGINADDADQAHSHNQVELSLRRRILEPSRDHLPAKVKMANPPELESLIMALHRRGEVLARIAVQELDNPRIAQAILYARSRGIDIALFGAGLLAESASDEHCRKRGAPRSGAPLKPFC
jgi:hypothetical protein